MKTHKKNILLVESSKAYQAVFTATFSNTDYKLIACESGEQALDYIKNNYVDFICSSFHLKDMNGIDLCEKMRTLTKSEHKPFVLLTSSESREMLQQALPSGVTDIFHKNDLERLLAFITRFPFLNAQIKGRVLYVEDAKSQRKVTTAILESHGITVNAFSAAEAALESFIDHEYDVVITDLVLEPGMMSGLTLVNQIRRHIGQKGDTPILATTAFDDKFRRLQLFHLGVSDYFVKPLLSEELIIRVRSLITRQKLMVANEEQQIAAMIYNTSSEAMFIADNNNQIIAVNPAFSKITGYSQQDVFGKSPNILSSGEHDENFYHDMWEKINTTGSWQGDIWNKRKNGELFLEQLAINTIYNQDGSVHRRIALFSDTTEKKKADDLILEQANFDMLTHLPNRRLFQEHLQREIKKSNRSQLPLALLFIDLDHFKNVNDSLGHDIGDELLIEAASRITACVRESDIVARLGGDEFTVILTELDDSPTIERITQSIIDTLQKSFLLEQHQIFISASVGITLYPDDATDAISMLKNADQAMYKAKTMGRNRFSYFTPSMQKEALKRQQLIEDLHIAIDTKQFELYYQPIVNCKTGELYKAEALLRWNHPTLGLVAPNDFIPVAEESGLITTIGDWVFKEASHQAKLWVDTYAANFQISINKSPVQFQATLDHETWLEHLTELELSGQNIAIEITESLLMDDNPKVAKKLSNFRNANIQISLDDFGTGYSSLSYLKQFDIDYLKMDRSFIKNLTPNSDDMALSEAIIVMAHKLGLKVIAEGVETEEQLQLLKASDCDYIQGFLISRPVPVAEFEKLLQE